ncbi:MAG: transcription factor WhiB [Mycobacterium sp.]|nr:transcription factor WhiB [Mycobacterium sp.]
MTALATEDLCGMGTVPATVPPCWSCDPELFFAERPDDVERAKAICGPCPLRDACLQGALDRGEPWGVWGGQLVLAGVVVPRKRPRGRPRKHPLPVGG